MTEQEAMGHRVKMLEQTEKKWYQSKKFLSWGIQQLLMAAMAVTALVTQPDLSWSLSAFMIGLVFMMGVSTMWMIGKQAAADIAVRGFAMIGKAAKPIEGQALKTAIGEISPLSSDR